MAKAAPSRILVRAPNWIGDQILAFPFYHYLRKAYPQAHITSICVEWARDCQFRDLVNEVHVLPRDVAHGAWGKFNYLESVAAPLRARPPWDLAISLPNSFSAAYLLYRSGARRRRGYRYEGRGFLLNDGLAWDPSPSRHRAQAYVDLLPPEARPEREVLEFWGIPPENELDQTIPGEMETFDPVRSWQATSPLQPPEGEYWVLAPGATAESRRWSLLSFLELGKKIHAETGLKGVIVGSAKEAPLASELCASAKGCFKDLTAQGPVSGLWKVFRHSKFTVTNESGLAHVAALCGAFVQIICGAADPRRTQPLGPGKIQIAVNPVDCWPCERNICSQPTESKLQCLKGISVDTVWGEIRRGIRLSS